MNMSQQVRRPLVSVALSMVAGLYLQRTFSLPALPLLALSALNLSVAVWSVRHRQVLFFTACLILAAAYGAVQQTRLPAGASLSVAETLFSRHEVIGTVAEDPQTSGEDDVLVFRFEAEAVRFADEWYASNAKFRVRMKTPETPVMYGERWRLTGRYRSYASGYGGTQGSFYTAGRDAQRIQEAPASLKGFCYPLRRRAARVFCLEMQSFPAHTHLLQALLLGYRYGLPEDLYRTFARTGTLHIFAISGLHVGVMAAIIIAALKLLGVSKPRWGFFLIPLLFFYVLSTGMKSSAFRAFTMASVYFAAPLIRRRPDSVSAIALAAIILLLINPLQLGDPGFLLSFTVVSGIVMVHRYVRHRFSGFSRPGWAVPLAQLSGPRPVIAAGRAVALLALTSAAAWLFSVPLTAAFFHTVSPAALLANLVVIPLTFMVVLTGCLSLLSAPLFSLATIIFNHANRIFITLLIAVIQGVETVPGAACRFVRAPSPVEMALWYGGLVLTFTAPRRLRRLGPPITLLAGLLWFINIPVHPQGIEIAKEADAAVLIQIEAKEPMLVVRGDSYSLGRGIRRLQKEGINRLSAVAVCGDRPDAAGLTRLCETFAVKNVWMLPAVRDGAAAQNAIWQGSEVFFSSQARWRVASGILSADLN